MKSMPKTWPAPVAEGGGAPFGAHTPAATERGPEEWPNGDVPRAFGGDALGAVPDRPGVPRETGLGTIRTSGGRSLKRTR